MPSARSACARSGCGADQPLDLAQLRERRARLVELAARDAGADEQLERGRAVEPAGAAGSLAQQPLDELDGPERVAPVERQPGAAELCRRSTSPPRSRSAAASSGLPCRRRSSASPTSGAADQAGRERAKSLDRGRAACASASAQRPRQSVHGTVLGATEGEHVAAAVALGELGDPVAPLERALVVEHGRARG